MVPRAAPGGGSRASVGTYGAMAREARRFREAEARLWRSLRVEPVDRRVDLPRMGVTLRVQELGEGPPVVFVHGATTSGASWAPLAARLSGFRRIVLDRPGCGLSDPLREPLDARSLPGFGETLVVDVLDALGVGTAHVVASSFGGYVALRTAAAHPDRVGRLVLFGWPAGVGSGRIPGHVRMTTVPMLGRLLSEGRPTESMVRGVFRLLRHRASLEAGRITAQDLAAYRALLGDTRTMTNEFKTATALIRPLRGMKKALVLDEELLARVKAPTYLVWGENDPFGGEETARRLAEALPHAELEIVPGGGHAPWFDDVPHAVQVTSRWLSG